MTDPIADHVVDEYLLKEFGAGSDWASRAAALALQQQRDWPMLAKGHATLGMAQVRPYRFDGFEIRTQFNPGRMTSVAAKVDPKAIQERKCFLCPAQLLPEQRGLRYGDYLIVCNPFPILDVHFTIPHVTHRPQRIEETFGDFLNLTRDLGTRYTLLYNGPKAGASAPDHLHFQAGTRGWMPTDTDYAPLRDRAGRLLCERAGAQVWAITDYLRPIVGLESSDAASLAATFGAMCTALREIKPVDDEPMMNILAWADLQGGATKYTVVIFPRGAHRPSCFHAEGDAKILVSPGAVDMAGVLITPLPESFDRLNPATIAKIYEEVSLPLDDFARLEARLASLRV